MTIGWLAGWLASWLFTHPLYDSTIKDSDSPAILGYEYMYIDRLFSPLSLARKSHVFFFYLHIYLVLSFSSEDQNGCD